MGGDGRMADGGFGMADGRDCFRGLRSFHPQSAIPHPRSAFTLIELLVVIGVIVLLIAIAVPVIGKARQAAVTTACLSNARQVGVLLNAYLAENDGRLPALQNRELKTDPLPAMDNTLVRPGDSLAAFACPADEKKLHETSGTSYFWNFTVNGQKIESLFSIIGGRDASRIPLLSDKEGFHPELRDKVNILYADGHVDKELNFSVDITP